MKLDMQVAAWDGKSTAWLEKIHSQHALRDSFTRDIVALIGSPEHQSGATWLLKRRLEFAAHQLDDEQIKDVCRLLPKVVRWDAKLHLLQCFPAWQFPTRLRKRIEAFLRECLDDENKFVRAWAYSGFWQLAQQFVVYEPEAKQLLEAAMQNESASIKARIRKIWPDAR